MLTEEKNQENAMALLHKIFDVCKENGADSYVDLLACVNAVINISLHMGYSHAEFTEMFASVMSAYEAELKKKDGFKKIT